MSESMQHQQLVKILTENAKSIIDEEYWGLICVDAAEYLSTPPQTNQGFRPDLHYCYQDLLVIGEAKTSADVERPHSKQQYESYICECSVFWGKAYLLLAVPWVERASITNIVNKIAKKYPGKYIVKIIEGVGGAL